MTACFSNRVIDIRGDPFITPSVVSNFQVSHDRSQAPIGATARVKAFSQTTGDVKTGSGEFKPSVTPKADLLETYANAGDARMAGAEMCTTSVAEGATDVRVPGFATLAGRIGYKLDHGLTLALSGQNLTTSRQVQSTGYEAPRQVLVSIRKAW